MLDLPKSRARLLRSLALDAGFATAEFAVVLPAVIFIGSIFVWVLSLCVTQLQIESAAYWATRELIRGDKIPARLIDALPHNSTLREQRSGNILTVTVATKRTIRIPGIPWAVELKAHASGHLEKPVDDENF